MRALSLLFIVVAAGTGCSIASLVLDVKTHCESDAACPPSEPECVAGVCVVDDDRPGGEGEGEFVGEGEGEFVGEGEGEFVGEGEGEALCPRSDQVRCGGVCVTANTDEHCGGCDPCVDDELACNGVESCVEGSCKGEPPCGSQQGCAEPGVCAGCSDTAPCVDDGVFCNGDEVCLTDATCESAGDRCPGQLCDEDNARCVDCRSDTDCQSGVCFDGSCVACRDNADCPPPSPCDIAVCDAHACSVAPKCTGACLAGGTCACTSNADCDDGVFCNGAETCDGRACVAASPVSCAAPESCDENVGACAVSGLCASMTESFESQTLDSRLVFTSTGPVSGTTTNGAFKVRLQSDANAGLFCDINGGATPPFRVEIVTTVPPVDGQQSLVVVGDEQTQALMIVNRSQLQARLIENNTPTEVDEPLLVTPATVRLAIEVSAEGAVGFRVKYLADVGNGEVLLRSVVVDAFPNPSLAQFIVQNFTSTTNAADVRIHDFDLHTTCP